MAAEAAEEGEAALAGVVALAAGAVASEVEVGFHLVQGNACVYDRMQIFFTV